MSLDITHLPGNPLAGDVIDKVNEIIDTASESGSVLTDWVVTTAYTSGSLVKYDGLTYRAINNTIGDAPDSSPEKWERWAFSDSELLSRVNRLLIKDVSEATVISGFNALPISEEEANNYGIIIITGTLSSSVYVLVPDNVGRWFIRNSTTGGFFISVASTIPTSSTVIIDPTFSDDVACDGNGNCYSTSFFVRLGSLSKTGDVATGPITGPESATTGEAGFVRLATAAEFAAGTDTNRALTPKVAREGNLMLSTAKSVTGMSVVDFIDIPDWTKRITVIIDRVSTVGGNATYLQIGDSGGIETSGYEGSSSSGNGAHYVSTSFFAIANTNLHGSVSGHIVLTRISGNTWICSGISIGWPGYIASVVGGSKTLSGTLDRLRLLNSNSDAFDSGTINIMCE